MKKIMITGGSGFIFSNFIRYLFNKYDDIQIVNYDCLTYAAKGKNLKDIEDTGHNLSPKYRLYENNVCDKINLDSVICYEKPDIIIHAAAESHVDRSLYQYESHNFIQTNIVGTYTILQAAKKYNIEKFIYIIVNYVKNMIKYRLLINISVLEPVLFK